MGRSPCCDNSSGLKKGPWTPEEDEKLTAYIQEHGYGSWRALPKLAGLNRCGKSCRLRWTNYLRPDIKRGKFADDEEALIIKLHSVLGNKWSRIATHLPGRTDNEIKNFWNTHIRKKLLQMGIDPITHKPRTDLNLLANLSHLLSTQNLTSTSGSMTMNQPPPSTTTNLANWDNMNALRLQSDATQLAKLQILSNIFQILNTNTSNSSPHLIPPPLLDQNTSHHHQLGGGGDGEGGFQNLLVSASSNGLTTPTTTMDPISFLGEFSNSSAAAAAASSHAYPWGTGGSPTTTTTTTIDRAYRSFISSSLADNNDQRAGPTENNVLPALVTFSPKQPSYSDAVQVEAISKSNTNSAYGSSACTDQSPSDDFFEGLDKLIDDDGTSGSFWKDFITN